MFVVIAGEGNQNHEHQRHNGKDQNPDNGEGQQERMQILLLQGADIIHESGNMLSLGLAHLGTVGALGRHAGNEDNAGSQNNGNNAVEQAEHGVVSQRIFINPQSLVVNLPLLHGAQRNKIADGTDTENNHVYNIQNLQCQEDQSPDNLLIHDVPKAEDKER